MVTKAYKTKSKKLAGSNYVEVHRKAFNFYTQIVKRSKRRTYMRSAYFKKDKIFLSLFWHHLQDKFNQKDRLWRLKFYPCALELIRNSKVDPESKENVDRKSEILHRFTGITPENEIFFVQIKENKNNNQKYLISVFPLGKH
jgi:hypothetical protein